MAILEFANRPGCMYIQYIAGTQTRGSAETDDPMNTNTFHSADFDAAFAPRKSKPPIVTLVEDSECLDFDSVDELDPFGETDLQILEAIVAAANR